MFSKASPMPMRWIQNIKKMNFSLSFFVLLSLVTGIIFIYGTGQQHSGRYAIYWIKQIIWVGIGGGFFLILSNIHYSFLGKFAEVVYGFSLLLLIVVLIYGRRINGAKSWLEVLPGISIQPSEIAKLGLILIIAKVASRPSVRFQYLSSLFPFLCLMGLPMLLITLQPDMGSAMVLIPITLAILFVSGVKKRWFVYGFIGVLLMSPIFYKFGLKDHQRKRIYTFLHPSKNQTNEGWNARQSLLAVGSGGWSGKGFMKGTQNILGFLPKTVTTTDFIFSVIAEETGFLGSIFVVFLLGGIVFSGFYIAGKAGDRLGCNMAIGITVMFSLHIYVNIGMTIGMAPIIGIPLPFISYGGSFMMLTLICIGILQSIYIHRQKTSI